MKISTTPASRLIIRSLCIPAAMLGPILFAGCQKDLSTKPGIIEPVLPYKGFPEKVAIDVTGDVRSWYTGLAPQTLWELQQARAATAKYHDDTLHAYKDGYRNIHVDVENMGHHFMKAAYVDGTFDPARPQILVYNGNADGSMELVAVEYAVPYNDPQPAGFTGDQDVWDHNATFQLWLLHAWVWKFNPNGVFNPLNPTVDLH